MKRFTETLKWDDQWFRSLAGVHKLIFLYVIDRCDNAGFWEVDEEAMAFHTKLDQKHFEGAWKGLERGLQWASGWVWAKNFLRHQKNDCLNPENPAHKQIVSLIRAQVDRFSECPDFKAFTAPYKGLLSPIGTGTGNGTGSEGMEGEDGGRKKRKARIPLNCEGFREFWTAYPRREAIADAESAWTRNGCIDLLPKILVAIRAAKASEKWTKDGGQFIPLPATWLNRRGWEDEVFSKPKITVRL